MTGIKETEDVLVAGEVVVTAVQKSFADGKFTFMDGRFFIPVVGAVKEAVDGASQIKAELKELSREESDKLTGELVDLVQHLVEALAPVLSAAAE